MANPGLLLKYWVCTWFVLVLLVLPPRLAPAVDVIASVPILSIHVVIEDTKPSVDNPSFKFKQSLQYREKNVNKAE